MIPITLGVVTGTLPGGEPWTLWLSTSAADVWPTRHTVVFLTPGGALGKVDPTSGRLLELTLPDVALRRFVEGAPAPWVVDVSGTVWEVTSDLDLIDTGRSVPARSTWIAWDGTDLLPAVSESRVRGIEELGIPRERRFQLRDLEWGYVDGEVWWARSYGEWGGAFGRPGGEVHQGHVRGFAAVQGRVVAYGGNHWMGHEDAEIYDGDTGATLLDQGQCGTGRPCAPLVWLGSSLNPGRVTMLTTHAQRFSAQLGSDGFTDWRAEGSLAAPSTGNDWFYGSSSAVRSARTGAAGITWIASVHGLYRVDGESALEVGRSGAPAAVDHLRWSGGSLWAHGPDRSWTRLEVGTWVREDPPAPPRSGEFEPRYVGSTLNSESGPEWWWSTFDGTTPRVMRQTADALTVAGEDVAPLSRPVLQSASGRVLPPHAQDTQETRLLPGTARDFVVYNQVWRAQTVNGEWRRIEVQQAGLRWYGRLPLDDGDLLALSRTGRWLLRVRGEDRDRLTRLPFEADELRMGADGSVLIIGAGLARWQHGVLAEVAIPARWGRVHEVEALPDGTLALTTALGVAVIHAAPPDGDYERGR